MRNKRIRNAREQVAARDGQTVHVKACCDLDVTIGYPRLTVKHDLGCPALRPDTLAGYAARMLANAAVDEMLRGMDLGPVARSGPERPTERRRSMNSVVATGQTGQVTVKRTKPTEADIMAARDQLAAVAALDDIIRTRADAYVAGAVDALDWTLGEADPVTRPTLGSSPDRHGLS